MFLSLMAGATIADWLSLLHFPIYQTSVYALDTEANQVYHPGANFQFPSKGLESFPWNVILLLGRYHRKHIFFSNRHPSLVNVNKSVQQFTNRFIWQWFFKMNGSSNLQQCFRVKTKHAANTSSLKNIPSDLKLWVDLFIKQARHLFLCSLGKSKRLLKFYSNTLPLDVDALK